MQFGSVISDVADKEGVYVDDNFCGHGIGRFLHSEPIISHDRNENNTIIEEGMVFTIEPILMLQPHSQLLQWPDGFTITSKNNPSSQLEHMVLVLQSGIEILTKSH
jgi:methionyl aminopeptidase